MQLPAGFGRQNPLASISFLGDNKNQISLWRKISSLLVSFLTVSAYLCIKTLIHSFVHSDDTDSIPEARHDSRS